MIAALLLIAAAQPAPGFGEPPRSPVSRAARAAAHPSGRGAVAAARPERRRLLDIDLSGLSDDDAVAIPAFASTLPLRPPHEERSGGQLDPGIARLITSVQIPAAPVTSGRSRSVDAARPRSSLARSTAPSYPPGRW